MNTVVIRLIINYYILRLYEVVITMIVSKSGIFIWSNVYFYNGHIFQEQWSLIKGLSNHITTLLHIVTYVCACAIKVEADVAIIIIDNISVHCIDIILTLYIASQMWTLGRLLPIVIGHLIPDDNPHWKHYLETLDIVDLIFLPTVRPETPGYLEILIEDNLHTFTVLYPEQGVIPKMHFLIHIPRFLARFVNINECQ